MADAVVIRDGMTYRQVERALRRMGFRVLRHSGDHAIWGLGPLRVAVRQGHPTERVPRNTVRQMALQARGEQPWGWGGYSEGSGEKMSEMTGLERLRALGREQEERSWSTVGKVRGRLMGEIARQIEGERLRERLAVGRVASEMELHVLGVEGMEDSPVARWARELREALGGRDEEVTDVAAIRKDAMEAYEWVEAHGGLEKIKQDALCWNTAEHVAQNTLDWLARVCPVAGIEKCGYGIALEKLEDVINSRLMPEGMEWLVEAVQLWVHGRPVIYGDGGSQQLERSERVKRPEPKDSWERLEEDAEKLACEYFGREREKCPCLGCRSREIDPCTAKDCEFNKTIDIVRRARALAGDA